MFGGILVTQNGEQEAALDNYFVATCAALQSDNVKRSLGGAYRLALILKEEGLNHQTAMDFLLCQFQQKLPTKIPNGWQDLLRERLDRAQFRVPESPDVYRLLGNQVVGPAGQFRVPTSFTAHKSPLFVCEDSGLLCIVGLEGLGFSDLLVFSIESRQCLGQFKLTFSGLTEEGTAGDPEIAVEAAKTIHSFVTVGSSPDQIFFFYLLGNDLGIDAVSVQRKKVVSLFLTSSPGL